ncbi:DUF222 domain-containing protein [Kribbella sp. NBC_01505]|uniref:DUF222 domain-containing protein n=1 Tax=Kribbella sp. NBC_01505 TaxID=2903580 RepID=UPI0038630347
METRSICISDEELLAGYLAGQPDLNPPPEQWPDAPDSLPPEDLYDPDDPGVPTVFSAEDLFDVPYQMNKVDALEWELWAGVDQDEAEREMLRRCAPPWVFLPPGGDLAAALEPVRPQAETPIALIELMKAATRMVSWAESIKAAAMASFFCQRRSQYDEMPRPAEADSSGRPVDPERSWAAEVGAALHLSADTATRHIETSLRLAGPLSATLTALRSGALTWSKALSISESTKALSDESAQAVEAHVLRRAASQTHANLRRSLRQQVAKHAAKTEADEHRDAVRERTCKIVPLAGGMAGLWVVHTADKIQQMWVTIQGMADLAKRPTSTHVDTNADADSSGAHMPRSRTADVDTGGSAGGAGADATTRVSTDAGGTSGTGSDAEPAASANSAEPGPVPESATGTDTNRESATGTDTNRESATGTDTNRESATGTDTNRESATGTDTNRESTAGTDTNRESTAETEAATYASADAEARTDANGVREASGSTGPADGSSDQRPSRDERTAEQRRADVMADVFEYMLHNGLDWLGRRLPDQHRRRPHIEVVIPASTLLGLDDDPCELSGYGPISAEMGRRIAMDGTWRRLLTDPMNGAVLEASTTRHDPGSLVSETLLARHPVCAWPGCNRASRECDRDHGTRFADSGTTSLAGLAPYCEYHHVIKDTPEWGWRTDNHPDGSVTLTTPTGYRYTTVPPARGPIQPRGSMEGGRGQPESAVRETSLDPPPF